MDALHHLRKSGNHTDHDDTPDLKPSDKPKILAAACTVARTIIEFLKNPPRLRQPQALSEKTAMMMPMQGQQMQGQQMVKDQPLNMDQLARSDVATQKNMIGERLFPMIERSHPALAGKITGMLLEMETPDLLQLLESPEALSEKTAEAIQVLESAMK